MSPDGRTGAEPPRTERHRPVSAALARAVVALRWPVILAWAALALGLTATLPSFVAGGGDAAPPVPRDIAAVAAERRAFEEFGTTAVSRLVVVQHDDAGLPPAAVAAAGDLSARVASRDRVPADLAMAVPVPDRPGLAGPGGRPRTVLNYLFTRPDVSVRGAVRAAHGYGAALGPDARVAGVTGAQAAWDEEARAIDDALPWVTLATVAVVVLVLGLAFRSPVPPLLALAGVAVAYLVDVRVIAEVADRLGYAVPRQAEPIVVALLFAVVTDYTAFMLFRTRQLLREGAAPRTAVRRAATSTMPVIAAATVTVAAGTAAVLLGSLEVFRAFAPALVVTALVAGAVSLTLVPAMLAVLGRSAFLPSRTASDRAAAAPPRARRFMARPLPAAATVALVSGALLAVAAAGLPQARLGFAGPFDAPSGSETRRAADAATRDLPPGVLAPVQLVVRGDGIGARGAGLAALQSALAGEPGVARVVGPGTPGADALPAGLVVAPRTDAARMVLVLDRDPYGPGAIDDLRRLEDRLPVLVAAAGLPGAEAELSGDTAVASQTVDLIRADLVRTGIACAVVVGLVMVLMLRALAAPLMVLACTALGLAATLSATQLILEALGESGGIAYYVPLAASILLVSLGSDYSMFLVSRVWDQGHVRIDRRVVARATAQSSAAISVAGAVLAASFALLAIVPATGLREFALAMTLGVLIDAFAVRGLLVPALLALLGERSRWPARPRPAPRPPAGRPSVVPPAGG